MTTPRARILLVKLSAIGDVVHTLPALNALRRHLPTAHITWLVEEAAAELVIGHPALDDVLVSRRKTWLKGLKANQRRQHLNEMTEFIGRLRRRRYDFVLDFQASLKGAVLIALTRARRKIGFGPGLEHQELSYLVLNERVPAVSMEIHALDRTLLMLQAMGITTKQVEYKLPITVFHHRNVERLQSELGRSAELPLVAINPMAQWESKLWTVEGFARVADHLQSKRGLSVVFTGGPGDKNYIEDIRARMNTQAANLAGKTDLLTLAALLKRARLVITTDTGPMHIAAAVGTPIVALFGPTAPWRTGPYGQGHRVIQDERHCQPCFKRRCLFPESCMLSITPEKVIGAVEDMISNLHIGIDQGKHERGFTAR